MNNSENRFPVKKLATCSRCGSNEVAWLRSFKTGKPYLVNVADDMTTCTSDWHSKTCPGTLKPAPGDAKPLADDKQLVSVGANNTGSRNDVEPEPEVLSNPRISADMLSCNGGNLPDDLVESVIADNRQRFIEMFSWQWSLPMPEAKPEAKPEVKQISAKKEAKYICPNSNCRVDSFIAIVQPGVIRCCPECSTRAKISF